MDHGPDSGCLTQSPVRNSTYQRRQQGREDKCSQKLFAQGKLDELNGSRYSDSIRDT